MCRVRLITGKLHGKGYVNPPKEKYKVLLYVLYSTDEYDIFFYYRYEIDASTSGLSFKIG